MQLYLWLEEHLMFLQMILSKYTVYLSNQSSIWLWFKGILHSFLEMGSFYHSPRVKKLSFTVFKSIQQIFWYLEEYQ